MAFFFCYASTGLGATATEGKTLAAWRREQQEGIPQKTVLDIVRQIASALDEAHRQEIIHRDVKPANIIDPDDSPLCDSLGWYP